MPWVDVTDVLLDPDIAGEQFTVVRRQGTVNNNGEQQIAVTFLPGIVGSVVPLGANSLLREEAFDAQLKTIRVITKQPLRARAERADGTDWLPDVVQWDGGNYLVRAIEDYSSFGAGMIVAECVIFDFIPPPPAASG